jgi:hypothetical protein
MKTQQPRKRTSPGPQSAVLERMNANVAGIDCGAAHHYVAVPVDRAPMPVQSFSTVTSGLRRLVEWLVACRVTSVAMEATGPPGVRPDWLDLGGLLTLLARHVHGDRPPAAAKPASFVIFCN